MTHLCVSKLTIIGSDNGLSPDRRQAIIWTNTGLLLIGPFGTNFSEIFIEILIFSFKKMRLKVSSAKRWPFCLGLNVLKLWLSVSQRRKDPRQQAPWYCPRPVICGQWHRRAQDTSKLAFTKRHYMCLLELEILCSSTKLTFVLMLSAWCVFHMSGCTLSVYYLRSHWVRVCLLKFTLLLSTWWTQNGFKSAHREHWH